MTQSLLDRLACITTPTVSNAMERVGIRADQTTYTPFDVTCRFPERPAIVGYAVTIKIRSRTPSTGQLASRQPNWDRILSYPGPRVVVAQDLDQPPLGAYWGEVNANIHRSLGCVGVITDGLVRDLDEVRDLGFGMWSRGVAVSHAYAHLEAFDVQVAIGDMLVNPGDVIHADKHGACVIPTNRLEDVLRGCQEVQDYEAPMLALAKSQHFTTAAMAELLKQETV
jgi:4-hydroxy-4-methyl-2-oxoglutarate aldolase